LCAKGQVEGAVKLRRAQTTKSQPMVELLPENIGIEEIMINLAKNDRLYM
jgi:hypothetical protein